MIPDLLSFTPLQSVIPQNKYIESGDRLGLGILYPSIKNQPGERACQVVLVYCALNGSVIYHRAMEQPAGGFYPIISLYKFGKFPEFPLFEPLIVGTVSMLNRGAIYFNFRSDAIFCRISFSQ